MIFLGQLLPAVLVTGAIGGRHAVRELFRRIFRWRVHPVWYLAALLAIPVVSLVASAVLFGPGALRALVTDPAVILAYLNQLTILPLVNLWEETAWMGTVQARPADSRGPVLAAVITGPLFGLVHLPHQLGKPLGELVVSLALLMTLSIGLRILIGRLYNVTAGSILLAAMVHVTFNATNNNNLLTRRRSRQQRARVRAMGRRCCAGCARRGADPWPTGRFRPSPARTSGRRARPPASSRRTGDRPALRVSCWRRCSSFEDSPRKLIRGELLRDAPGSAAKRAADCAGRRSNTGRRPDRRRVHRFDG